MTNSTVIAITLVTFQLTLLAIGVWAERRTKTKDDFFIGGARLGPIVAGLSYAASTSSVWVLLGFAGFVYSVGVSALWMLPGIWAGYAIVWLVLGGALNAETHRQGHVTLTDYLAFGHGSSGRKVIAAVAAVLIIFCFTFYVASQFQGAGRAFQIYFDWDFGPSVFIGAVVVLFYTLLGGFWAVSVTDTLQGLLMAAVAVTLPLIAVAAVGGPGELLQALPQRVPEHFFDWSGGHSGISMLAFVIGAAAVGLGTFGQPHLLNRIMALRDEKARRQGFAVAITWGVLVYLGMVVLAFCGRVLLPELPNAETLLFRMAGELLPHVLGGIVLAAVLSAIMSTVDSQLLVVAASVSHDLRVASLVPQRALLISRLIMAVVAALAVTLTFAVPDTIFQRVLFAWTALGASFGPIVIMRVLGRRHGVIAISVSMLLGFFTAVGFYLHPDSPGDIAERVVPWLVSLGFLALTAKPSPASRRLTGRS